MNADIFTHLTHSVEVGYDDEGSYVQVQVPIIPIIPIIPFDVFHHTRSIGHQSLVIFVTSVYMLSIRSYLFESFINRERDQPTAHPCVFVSDREDGFIRLDHILPANPRSAVPALGLNDGRSAPCEQALVGNMAI